jgi:error-prone DNA polymerase
MDARKEITRIILSAGTIDVNGRIRCEGEVVVVANHLTDLSSDLAGVGDRDDNFPLRGRSNEFHHGNPGIDARSLRPKVPNPGTTTS